MMSQEMNLEDARIIATAALAEALVITDRGDLRQATAYDFNVSDLTPAMRRTSARTLMAFQVVQRHLPVVRTYGPFQPGEFDYWHYRGWTKTRREEWKRRMEERGLEIER